MQTVPSKRSHCLFGCCGMQAQPRYRSHGDCTVPLQIVGPLRSIIREERTQETSEEFTLGVCLVCLALPRFVPRHLFSGYFQREACKGSRLSQTLGAACCMALSEGHGRDGCRLV
jgi:hypothetical protein